MRPFVDAYAVLGVPAGSSQEELKAAHRQLVRQHHPDLTPPDARAEATRRVQEINVAYGLVRDPGHRARYDRARAAWLVRERARAAAAPAPVDAALAREWDRALVGAGRWAGRWWRRNRATVQRAAAKGRATAGQARGGTKRAARDAAGRVLWLLAAALGTVGGYLLASTADRLAGGRTPVPALIGAVGGMWLGSTRGWHARLRLAGVQPRTNALRLGAALWVVGVAGAILLGR